MIGERGATVRVEAMRAAADRSYLWMTLGGIMFMALAATGLGRQNDEQLAAGEIDLSNAVDAMLSQGFAALLFATIAGALLVTNEYKHATMGRTVFAAGGAPQVFASKAVASLVPGALFGLVGASTSVAATYVWLAANDRAMIWDSSALLTVVGVVAVSVLAGPWGVALGWLVRGQTATVAVILLWTLGIESAFVELWPDVGQWLLGGAQAALYRDASTDHHSMAVGAVLVAAWVAAGLLVSYSARRRSDVM